MKAPQNYRDVFLINSIFVTNFTVCYSSYTALKWKRSVQHLKVGTVNAVLESKLDCSVYIC